MNHFLDVILAKTKQSENGASVSNIKNLRKEEGGKIITNEEECFNVAKQIQWCFGIVSGGMSSKI